MMCSNSYRNHYIKVGQHPKCVVSSIERAGQPLVKQTVSSAEICNQIMKNNIVIRLEEKSEYCEVENLVRDSFWNVYRSGCLEHYVINQLRNDPAFVPELDFVMYLKESDEEGKLIGQNMFMRTSIKADDGRNIPIMTMGPICIKNEYMLWSSFFVTFVAKKFIGLLLG